MADLPEGRIKVTPETFIVQELIYPEVRPIPLFQETCVKGPTRSGVTLFDLVKRSFATEAAVSVVAEQVNVPFEAISFYGLKDKHAFTSQRIGISGDFYPQFSHANIFIRQVGENAAFPLRRGGNAGNRFVIEVFTDAERANLEGLKRMPNFFGEQRISSYRSCSVGKFLLEGDFEKAAEIASEFRESKRKLYTARFNTSCMKEAWLHPRNRFMFEFAISKWQSFLWNKLLKQALQSESGFMPNRLPMWSPESADFYAHLWEPKTLDEDVAKATAKTWRDTFVFPKNVSAERTENGWRFKFDLPPGSYATVFLSQLFRLVK